MRHVNRCLQNQLTMGSPRRIWETGLGNSASIDKRVAGYRLGDLPGNVTYTEVLYLVIKHRLPDGRAKTMLDACLTSIVDYGADGPFAAIARFVVANNPNPIAAVAAGLLAIGEYAGGAQTHVVSLIKEGLALASSGGMKDAAREVVASCLSKGVFVPGLGSRLHRQGQDDERIAALRRVAKATGYSGDEHVAFFDLVRAALSEAKGIDLAMNIDGYMGSILAAMGFDEVETAALEVAVMLPAIMGHAIEGIHSGQRMVMLPADLVGYVGPDARDLPATEKR